MAVTICRVIFLSKTTHLGFVQAFINTARKIYEKIEQGVFDVTNEVSTLQSCE